MAKEGTSTRRCAAGTPLPSPPVSFLPPARAVAVCINLHTDQVHTLKGSASPPHPPPSHRRNGVDMDVLPLFRLLLHDHVTFISLPLLLMLLLL